MTSGVFSRFLKNDRRGRFLVLCVAAVAFSAAQQRDRAPAPAAPTGTASLAGVITTDERPSAPIRGAIVTLTAAELPGGRSVMTDPDGRFVFDNLPAGRYTISASKAPFISTSYGAKRPGRPGSPMTLGERDAITDIAIRLARGAVITGTLRDPQNEPLAGVSVAVINVDNASPSRPAPVAQTASTDDRGVYRFFGLSPGKYVVYMPRPQTTGEMGKLTSREIDAALASLQARTGRSVPSGPGIPAGGIPPGVDPNTPTRVTTLGFAPVFYPGTPIAGQATTIALSIGEERSGIDFPVDFVRTGSIEGTIVNPENVPVQMILTPADTLLPLTSILVPTLTPPGPDGRFKYTNVAPGAYTIIARSSPNAVAPTSAGTGGGAGGIGVGRGAPAPAGSGRLLWAMADVNVSGDAIGGVTLALQPAMRLAGRIAFDATALTPPDLAQVRVTMISTQFRGSASMNGTILGSVAVPPGQVRPDGTFELSGVVPGTYRVGVTLPGQDQWWVRAVIVGNRDVLDLPLEFGRTGDVSGAVVTLTDKHSEISGTLQTPTGSAATDYFVAVFPADRSLWAASRRIRSARPASDGQFTFKDLPAGDYLAAALADLDPASLNDSSFLEQLVAASVKVTLAEGQRQTQHLRIGR